MNDEGIDSTRNLGLFEEGTKVLVHPRLMMDIGPYIVICGLKCQPYGHCSSNRRHEIDWAEVALLSRLRSIEPLEG